MKLSKSTNMKEQSEKAAHTLRTFLEKAKIPPIVIAKAQGLAIFTAFRAGMYFAGTAGTGIMIARLPDGTWSPPSAFTVRSGSIGIVYGADVFDCICVFNTKEAMDDYQKSEMQLGGGVTLAAGPVGGDANTSERKPIWTYTRSRGLYGGITLDSTVISESSEANSEFYGGPATAKQILSGEVKGKEGPTHWPAGAKELIRLLEEVDKGGRSS